MYMCIKSINYWELQIAKEMRKRQDFRNEEEISKAYSKLADLRTKLAGML